MRNFIITMLIMCLLSFTNNAISETSPSASPSKTSSKELRHKKIIANSYTINVGRGATYFGISKQLSQVAGVNWSWDLVDTVKGYHQLKYKDEVLKPNHRFTVSL
ncbi:hypothetical protein [Flammeovirga sp. EKP202]|uniref:hypothetical protein n=1 Tax=Flammeovirga sp. EKP202 TaxID=2770592 RepID=UPI00165F2D91|nr:hypothetical protein [Flammeovirga sp. EKP202]MBD0400753.1 hypothetical protein [Flammeovirga sp. EKP202]